MTESRSKDKAKTRRQAKKRTIELMRRKGKKAFRGKPFSRPLSSFLCGPCSKTKGKQVRHSHNSTIGRLHFGESIGDSYKLPVPCLPCHGKGFMVALASDNLPASQTKKRCLRCKGTGVLK